MSIHICNFSDFCGTIHKCLGLPLLDYTDWSYARYICFLEYLEKSLEMRKDFYTCIPLEQMIKQRICNLVYIPCFEENQDFLRKSLEEQQIDIVFEHKLSFFN